MCHMLCKTVAITHWLSGDKSSWKMSYSAWFLWTFRVHLSFMCRLLKMSFCRVS